MKLNSNNSALYYSLKKQSPVVDFKSATLTGQAPDGGLYFPKEIPKYNADDISCLLELGVEEIAFRVMQPYTEGSLPEHILAEVVKETFSFPIPLKKINDDVYVLELFHGPTQAFKDVGARFMSRCLRYFARDISRPVTVLVATSGDTGGAVAHGFHGVEGIRVVILYPSRKVSPVQEKQLTTLGKNILAIEVEGNFDDCQRLVKQAFSDQELRSRVFLTSANSINVARWLPQQVYYFLTLQQWIQTRAIHSGKTSLHHSGNDAFASEHYPPDKSKFIRNREAGKPRQSIDFNDAPVISVPSGNFGNICAGLLAQASGLPVKHFIAACNKNDTVPRFLQTGVYQSLPAKPSLSNAMDVADPSNFIRILELFNQDSTWLSAALSAYSIDDATTKETITHLYNRYKYLADPHGAVGFRALEVYRKNHPDARGIFLETAHPVKFPEAYADPSLPLLPVPNVVAEIMKKQKYSVIMKPEYQHLKDLLLQVFA